MPSTCIQLRSFFCLEMGLTPPLLYVCIMFLYIQSFMCILMYTYFILWLTGLHCFIYFVALIFSALATAKFFSTLLGPFTYSHPYKVFCVCLFLWGLVFLSLFCLFVCLFVSTCGSSWGQGLNLATALTMPDP